MHERPRRGQQCASSPRMPERPASDPRTLQLCARVRRTLELTLESELGDEALHDLVIHEVLPDPDQRRLLIVLQQGDASAGDGIEACMDRLKAVRGLLRSRVAAALQRKKTPQLAFALLPRNAFVADSETTS